MSIQQYAVTEMFQGLDVQIGRRARRADVEFSSSGTTASITVRGVGRPTRLVLDRATLHVLAGAFTRSLNNARRANRLRGIGGFTSRDEVVGWTMRSGNQDRQVSVALEADANTLTVTISGLSKNQISFVLDPEDIRLLTWFWSKALFNVGVAQRIRA